MSTARKKPAKKKPAAKRAPPSLARAFADFADDHHLTSSQRIEVLLAFVEELGERESLASYLDTWTPWRRR